MLDTINGLPAHVLLIHVIVVLAPLGAVFTILSAVWTKARHKLGVWSPITCLIVLVTTPITEQAGEWLQGKLTKNGPNKAIAKHADLGRTFLLFAIGLFVMSTAVWWIGRRVDRSATARTDADRSDRSAASDGADGSTGTGGNGGNGGTATLTRAAAATRTAVPVAVRYAVSVVAVVVSIATVVQLLRIGDSGASASWDYVHKLP